MDFTSSHTVLLRVDPEGSHEFSHPTFTLGYTRIAVVLTSLIHFGLRMAGERPLVDSIQLGVKVNLNGGHCFTTQMCVTKGYLVPLFSLESPLEAGLHYAEFLFTEPTVEVSQQTILLSLHAHLCGHGEIHEALVNAKRQAEVEEHTLYAMKVQLLECQAQLSACQRELQAVRNKAGAGSDLLPEIHAQQRELTRRLDERMCPVCLDNERKFAFPQCGHVVCEVCKDRVLRRCPVCNCRNLQNDLVRVYL
jgi:hypothetical protein